MTGAPSSIAAARVARGCNAPLVNVDTGDFERAGRLAALRRAGGGLENREQDQWPYMS